MVLERLGKLKENIPLISRPEIEKDERITKKPQHLAITMEGLLWYAKNFKEEYAESCKKSFVILKNLVGFQIKTGIPILTVNIISEDLKREQENHAILVDALAQFLAETVKDDTVHNNKVKITIFGKWYDMPAKVIDPIKCLLEETKDYDSFFLNLCINYNGQEEIVDACRLIARQCNAGKIIPESIQKDTIKANCYSSYFIPPDLVIKTGHNKSIPGLLLWDSIHAYIYFADKSWPELKIADLQKALREF